MINFSKIFKKNNKDNKGFGIFEIIVIIAIISLLAMLVISWVASNRPKGRDAKRVSELNSLRNALQMYYMEHGRFPISTEDEEILCKLEADEGDSYYCEGLYSDDGKFILEPYLRRVSDPLWPREAPEGKAWSYRYQSTSSGMGYKLYTDLETRDPYEIIYGAWYAGEWDLPPDVIPPLAVNDTAVGEMGVTIEIDVLANDIKGTYEIDPNTLTIYTDPGDGTAAVVSGKVEYTPEGDFVGQDSFQYFVRDTAGNKSNLANVDIEIFSELPVFCDSCSNCNDLIQAAELGDTIALQNNISNHHGTCIVFNGKQDVTFNCGGYTISGDRKSAPSGHFYGIYLSFNSNENTIKNCNVQNFQSGIAIDNSSFVDLDNINSSNNIDYSIYLNNVTNSSFTDVTTENNNQNGFDMFNSNNNTITNLSSENNKSKGLYLNYSDNNSFTGLSLKNNDIYGLDIFRSGNNNYSNSVIRDNKRYDVWLNVNEDSQCVNVFDNVTGTNDDTIEYYHTNSVINILDGLTFSQLILCNVDGSSLNNVTINGDDNNSLLIWRTSDSTISGLTSIGNYDGLYLNSSHSNNFSDMSLNNNYYGLRFSDSRYNNYSNSDIKNNKTYDVWLWTSIGYCDNTFSSITGTNNHSIEYYHSSAATINNETFSQLILCNADGSSLNNVTINGDDNNGLLLWHTNSSNISGLMSSGNRLGAYLRYSNNNTFNGPIVNNNAESGISIRDSLNNNFNQITANNNRYGFMMRDSSGNAVNDSFLTNSSIRDVEQSNLSSDGYCNNEISNTIGTNNYPIGYYHSSAATINNETFSQLILCNANGSSLNNVTINGNNNNGLFIYRTDDSSFNEVRSLNNYWGIRMEDSSHNSFTNTDVKNNYWRGISISGGGNNEFDSCSIEENRRWGFSVENSSNNTLVSSTVKDTTSAGSGYTNAGIYFNTSGNTVYNNIIHNPTVPDFAHSLASPPNNTWNIHPPVFGFNIVGGNWLAGNFWGKYTTCIDSNNNGLCDDPYNVDAGEPGCSGSTINCDWYPLKD